MAKATKQGRAVYRIMVTPSAKSTMEEITARIGITQIAMFSKLIDWLATQPDEIKLALLGVYPGLVTEDLTTLIVKRMIDPKQPAPTAGDVPRRALRKSQLQ